MRKFSKINESKEKILDLIGYSEKDIQDIFQDLIDEYEFEFSIKSEYLSLNGRTYSKANQTLKYFPMIKVELKRYLDEASEKDPRSWDGGLYYESDSDLIKTMYEVIGRLRSMVNSDNIKVYYCIRSLNDISIRIVTDIENSELPINIESIEKFYDNFTDLLFYDEYKVDENFVMGNTRHFDISSNGRHFNTYIENIENNSKIDNITIRSLKDNRYNNINDLIDIFNDLVDKMVKKCCPKKDKININYIEKNTNKLDHTIYLRSEGVNLIEFDISFDKRLSFDLIIKKGIFKNQTTTMTIYNLGIKIIILAGK